MAARKRKAYESMKRYRTNLANEQDKINRKLRNRILWPGEYGTARRSIVDGVNVLTNGKVAVRV